MDGLPDSFDPATRAWLASQFDRPTPVQQRGWPLLASGANALLVAPTGSGKTLAAFLSAIDRLGRLPADAAPGVRVVYVSPLKALVYDIERNLAKPLAGIAAQAARQASGGANVSGEKDASGEAPASREAESARGASEVAPGKGFRAPRIAIRTGDSTAKERRDQARDPAEILVTTPESLYLILGSKQGETLRSVETIIVDEIHALAPTKRGVHLMLSLERLARRCVGGDPQRIGLSATARPTDAIARFLAGDRKVEIVDTSRAPSLELTVRVPVPDMTRPQDGGRHARDAEFDSDSDPAGGSGDRPQRPVSSGEADTSLWPAIYPELLELIRAHRSSILFVNSRALCERLAHRLNELALEPLVRAHHGSLAHAKRKEIEEALAEGALRAIVATSSLELGIDMASVELVMLVESPGAVSRGLQRIGRAGHAVGATSRGVVFPKHRSDLLEAVVVAQGMREGAVEAISIPRNPLDVLAQQIVALVAEGPIRVGDVEALLSRTESYASLGRPLLCAVLDMLAGRYPSTDFAELRPRLHWDRAGDVLEIREGAGRIALLSGGTIPDRGQYAVHLGLDGPRIGELDEEMVHETKPGDVVTLGASSWRALEITRDRVIVAPAPGEPGRLPFWRGDGPGRPIELGRALGRFTREVLDLLGPPAGAHAKTTALAEDPAKAHAARSLRASHGLDEFAAQNLIDYLASQRDWTGHCPTDRRITIERFRDELGDWRLCILSPFGSRIHAPWALAIASQLAERGDFDAQPLWTDDGLMFRFADADRLPPLDLFLPDPDELEERVTDQLGGSALFASQFRENAARGLLLPRRRPGARTPLWAQRLRAQNLHAVARGFPDFPIMLETYRSCLQDVFDLPGLVDLMSGIRSREIAVDEVETASASPFARSLVFSYTATYLYQLDMPAAERRTQALSLDRHMLRELLGAEALRELLDAAVIDRIEARRQGTDPELRARHADALHDTLRRVGDLGEAELAARFEAESGSVSEAIESLAHAGRAIVVRVAGASRWIASEDAALYRDALGVSLPAGLPEAFLEPGAAPLEQLLMRYARTHGPFETERIAARFGSVPGQLEPVLQSLASRGRLVAGEFDPRGSRREWCEPEILRRIKRGTLERLRNEISPVPGDGFGRFLIDWHGVASGREAGIDDGAGRRGDAGLDDVIDRLEGLPISFAELERSVLPARVTDYAPRMLDERGAQGQLVWVGCGSIGERDGRIALYRRDRIASLRDRPEAPDSTQDPLGRALLERLEAGGASFFSELVAGVPDAESQDVFAALWDLVWRGLVTNDTFAPLRGLGRKPAAHRRRGRQGRSAPLPRSRGPAISAAAPSPAPGPASTSTSSSSTASWAAATAGRWSLVSKLLVDPPSETERLHARTLTYLGRHGIVSRESMGLEEQRGGFGAIYPVLREMEEVGRIRRGHFVEGASSAQFAVPGAVDRLRALRDRGSESRAVLLATNDPAQPYGSQLPWPEVRNVGDGRSGKPRRAVGSHVVLVDGAPSLFVDGGGARILCFEDPEEAASAERIERALEVLLQSVERVADQRLAVEEVDGVPARRSALAAIFVRVGFRPGYRGFEAEAPR